MGTSEKALREQLQRQLEDLLEQVPFVRLMRWQTDLKGAAYVAGEPAEIARRLEWKQVPTGANFALINPYDDGVFFGTRTIKGDAVVSDVQLYLDLVGSKTRGEEAATFVLEQRLRSRW